MRNCRRSRPGFTLVELLVVLALMVILAGMTVGFLPNAINSASERRAGQLVQSWLNIARQRAMREQAPRGLRLWIESPNTFLIGAKPMNNVVIQCQYIEQPTDYAPIPGLGLQIISDVPLPVPGGATTLNTLAFFPAPIPLSPPLPPAAPHYPGALSDPSNSLRNGMPYIVATAATDQQYWSVQPNDNIEIGGTGLMHRITAIGVGGRGEYIHIDPPLATPIAFGQQTYNYRIQRRPRTVGNDLLTMPDGTVIDVGTNMAAPVGFAAPNNNPLPWDNSLPAAPIPPASPIAQGYYVDIMFSPTGSVITPKIHTQTLNLWVRAPDENNPNNVFHGAPTIIAVHVTTGLVGAYSPPPGKAPANPYANVQ